MDSIYGHQDKSMSQLIDEMKIEIQSLTDEECVLDVIGIDAPIGLHLYK